MIDAHCHLNDPRLLIHLKTYLTHMAEYDVHGALVVGCDLPSSRMAVELAERYPDNLRASVGMHPHDSKDLDDDALATLRSLAQHPLVVAIGEIGLDYFYDHSPREVQQQAFRRQLALAAEVGLPIIIHEREAVDDVMRIMDAQQGWALGGAWHCCSTSPERAREISDALFIGIAGWITFKNSANIRELACAVPLNRMLIETDAPYITPVPYRGKPNEPAYIRFTAQALAELKGVTPESVDELTTLSTMAAFPRWQRR